MSTLKENLTRNFSTLRKDQAEIIYNATELETRRAIEDKIMELQELMMKRDQFLLDVAPNNALDTKITSSSWKAKEYVNMRMEAALEIRDARIELEEFLRIYKEDFGEDYVDPRGRINDLLGITKPSTE